MDTATPSDLIYSDWMVTEPQFVPSHLHSRETVFTIGNGYLSTRGSFEEGYPQAVPATLIHGVYDDVPVMFTELANCPDGLSLVLLLWGEGEKRRERFRLDQGEILSYQRQLDLRWGILSRTLRWRSPTGKTLDLHFERFTSLADQHVLGLRCQITAVNFDLQLEVQAGINGYAENQGFNHWEWLDQGQVDQDGQGIWLQGRTRSSRIELGIAARLQVIGIETELEVTNVPGYPTLSTQFFLKAGQTVTVEKVLSIFTSREVENPATTAQNKLSQLPAYPVLLTAHQQAWDQLWQQSDVVITGDRQAQLAVRYNLFQILISAPRDDPRVSIPAKTLSGFGYRGHIFWDTEIFILPFLIFTQPQLARNLLTYRYHTLAGARRKAAHYGYKGAMYAWESAVTGDDVTPRWAIPNQPYGEDVRIWCSDREIHINADIAYAVWYYWQATGDDEWMRDYGAEIILDTAIFWMSRVEWNADQERYEIREVIGADEFHEHVSNNAFTNRIVQWHLQQALSIYDWLQDTSPAQAVTLAEKLQLTPERRDRWQDIAEHLWFAYDPETELIEQFEGFFQLQDINLQDYEPRDRSMQVILGIDGANKHQVLKQPDVLMLLYLLRPTQEFPYNPKVLKANWDYYEPRTDITYGSSLGPAIHAILASELGQVTEAYKRFQQAALVDLEDLRGNTPEGIHGASAGGVWQAVVFGFAGIMFDGEPIAHPHLPPNWTGLQFKLQWRGKWHEFNLKVNQEPSLPVARSGG